MWRWHLYVRLDSGTKDLVIAQYPLDEIVRNQSVNMPASLFEGESV